MGFEIALVDEIDSVAVAEVEPFWVVGVMAGADGVDVVLLEQLYILNHAAQGDGLAVVWVVLVAVDAFEEYCFSVYQDLATL